MRLCTFRDSAGTRLGRVDGDTVRPLAGADVSAALGGTVPAEDGDARPSRAWSCCRRWCPGRSSGSA